MEPLLPAAMDTQQRHDSTVPPRRHLRSRTPHRLGKARNSRRFIWAVAFLRCLRLRSREKSGGKRTGRNHPKHMAVLLAHSVLRRTGSCVAIGSSAERLPHSRSFRARLHFSLHLNASEEVEITRRAQRVGSAFASMSYCTRRGVPKRRQLPFCRFIVAHAIRGALPR